MFELILALIVAAVVALDQWTKHLVLLNIPLDGEVPLLPKVVHLTYLQNSGAAFSILQGQRLWFAVLTVAFLIALVYFVWKKLLPKPALVLLAFIAGGAIGNFIDRMAYGYVVDMFELEFMDFPVFNLADCAIVVSCILFILFTFFPKKSKKTEG